MGEVVHSDIWDDCPPVSSSVPACSTAASDCNAGRGVSVASSVCTDMGSVPEVFLPWANGDGVAGMDALTTPSETAAVERRMAKLLDSCSAGTVRPDADRGT